MCDKFTKGLVLFLTILFIMTFTACRTTGGRMGIDWGTGAKHDTAQSPQDPYSKHKGEKNGPPAHAPAHGYRAKHHYRYYPDASVYYDTAKDVYFYLDNDSWRISVSLPSSIRLGSTYVSLELDTDKPYKYHHEHKVKYPPGKMKKNKKNKKWAKH